MLLLNAIGSWFEKTVNGFVFGTKNSKLTVTGFLNFIGNYNYQHTFPNKNGIVALLSDLGGASYVIDTTAAPIQWNMNNLGTVVLIGSNPIAANKTWQFINAAIAKRFTIIVQFNGTPVQTMPGEVLMNDVRWDGVAKTFTPLEQGLYKVQGDWNGTNWLVDISQSFYQ